MSKEQFSKIISNARDTLDKSILENISDFRYKELDGYYVIEVYVKADIKAKEMGEIVINVEEFAKICGFNILVDFLRG